MMCCREFNSQPYVVVFNVCILIAFVVWVITNNETMRWIACGITLIKFISTFLPFRRYQIIVEVDGDEIEVEDETVYVTGCELNQMYVAKRNSGWKLCTLRDPLTPSPGRKGKTYWSGYMYNNEDQYPYNSFEAHLVK